MPRVVHFEIHADEPERAVKFYETVFGWTTQKWGGPADYWLLTTGDASEPGINGAILKRMGPINGDSVIAYVCTIDVPDIDAYIEKALTAGATTALPKHPIPGVGYLAYFKDTEGNIFGITENDPTAQ